jgi:hypothetical protein
MQREYQPIDKARGAGRRAALRSAPRSFSLSAFGYQKRLKADS